MIEIKNLTEKDVGKWVEYRAIGKGDIGRIKSWNDLYIFVVYNCDNNWKNFQNYTAAATRPESLHFIPKPTNIKKMSIKRWRSPVRVNK